MGTTEPLTIVRSVGRSEMARGGEDGKVDRSGGGAGHVHVFVLAACKIYALYTYVVVGAHGNSIAWVLSAGILSTGTRTDRVAVTLHETLKRGRINRN